MTDAMIKKGASTAECPKPENPAFVIPKPLSDSKVAIVTSASLHHEDDDDFAPSDTGSFGLPLAVIDRPWFEDRLDLSPEPITTRW